MDPQLLSLLEGVDPEELAQALCDLGLGFDVGSALLTMNPSKEVPGPDPWDPPETGSGIVYVRGFDRERQAHAAAGLREIMGWHRPVFDPQDTAVLKMRRPDRRRLEREAERWRDPVPRVLDAVRRQGFRYNLTPTHGAGALTSREEAEALVERLRACGWDAGVNGFDPEQTSHTVYLFASTQPRA